MILVRVYVNVNSNQKHQNGAPLAIVRHHSTNKSHRIPNQAPSLHPSTNFKSNRKQYLNDIRIYWFRVNKSWTDVHALALAGTKEMCCFWRKSSSHARAHSFPGYFQSIFHLSACFFFLFYLFFGHSMCKRARAIAVIIRIELRWWSSVYFSYFR